MPAGQRPRAELILLLALAMAEPAHAMNRLPPCVRPAPRRFADGDVIRLSQRTQYLCKVELVETGLVLKSDVAGTIPDPGSNIVINSKFQIYSNSSVRGTIAVWKPDGTYDRSFGREGNGPKEFQRGNFMLFIDGQDRLHVLTGSRQWSVLTSSLEWVAQIPVMPILVDDDFTIVTPNGTVVSSAPQETWFSTADFRGNLIARFGDYRTGGVSSPRAEDHLRQIAYAGNDRFWATPERGSKDGYAIELWGLDGKRHVTLKRDVPWYPNGSGMPIARDQRPPPFVAAVHADTSGLLITLTVIANANWDRLATSAPEQRREISDQAYSGYLEVIDARAGVVLASEYYPPPGVGRLITRFLPGRLMGYRNVDTPDGLREVHFFEIRLTQR